MSSNPIDFAGLPVLATNAVELLDQSARRWAAERRKLTTRALKLQLAASRPVTAARGAYLERLAAAAVELRDVVDTLLHDLKPGLAWPNVESNGRLHIPALPYLFRDRVWGGSELGATQSMIESLGHEPPSGATMWVPAGGAGALAERLHVRWSLRASTVVDKDPLFAAVHRQRCTGHTVRLLEIPTNPVSAAESVCRHELGADDVPVGLMLQLGDANDPGEVGRYDVVLTQFALDIPDARLERVLDQIEARLAPGGRWFNIGPVSRIDPLSVNAWTPDLVRQLIGSRGWSIESDATDWLPHLASPHSLRHQRFQVWAFVATRPSP